METAAAGLQLFVLFLRLRGEEGSSSSRRSRKNNQVKKVKAKGQRRKMGLGKSKVMG